MAEWIITFFSIADPKIVKQVTNLVNSIPYAIWETLYSTMVATLMAHLIGLPLGIILVTGAQDGVRPLPRPLMQVLNVVVNLLRSVPFLILMVMVMPLSRVILGTTIGTPGILVPLTVAAAPFVARLVESSLREMDRGLIEAAQAMGCSTLQIVWKVMLPESLPSLLSGFTTAFITILGYGAMAGAIGGGGLGAMAMMDGWTQRQKVVLYTAVVVLVILVQIFQSFGSHLSARVDKRVTNRTARKNTRESSGRRIQKDKRDSGGYGSMR